MFDDDDLNYILNFKYKIINEGAKAPIKKNGDIGWDLFCVEDHKFHDVFENGKFQNQKCYELQAGTRRTFKTGISIELPEFYHAILKPRSGLAVKDGIDVLAGVIDNSYRGEILVCLQNLSHHTVRICAGDKIAQMIIVKENEGRFTKVSELSETDRGENGFGSTGK